MAVFTAAAAIGGALLGGALGLGGAAMAATVLGGAFIGSQIDAGQAAAKSQKAQLAQQEQAMAQQQQQQQQAMEMQRQAQAQQQENVLRAERSQQMAYNSVNRNSPSTAAAVASGGGGPSATMLTGPTGVDQDDLKLGRRTLLGR
jgi:3-deoxy-D-manno-octulosonic-acid transferase